MTRDQNGGEAEPAARPSPSSASPVSPTRFSPSDDRSLGRRSLLVGCVDDDPATARLLQRCLSEAGHSGEFAASGREALVLFDRSTYFDALIIDVRLPDVDGRELCSLLLQRGQRAPSMFLSAARDVEDIVLGFRAGGLDYMTKPFAVAELIVRLEALASRVEPNPSRRGSWLDGDRLALHFRDRQRQLTPTEYVLYSELLGRAGRLVTREDLMRVAWPPGARVTNTTFDTYVYRLRQHLGALQAPESIRTVRGLGYVLEADPHRFNT